MQNLDLSLGTPFATGRTAEFYPWKDGYALKLFRLGWGEESVYYEAEKARAVHAAGLPVPEVGEVVQVNGRPGIIYERLVGVPLNQLLQTKPWTLFSTARLMADLHLKIHSQNIPILPPLKDRLGRHIKSVDGMPGDVKKVLLDVLDSLPDGNVVCHGDFHPMNIFITPQGPIILDWMDATRGHPAGDVARTSFLMKKAVLPADLPMRGFIQLMRSQLTRSYLKHYSSCQSFEHLEWERWQVVISAARLAEDIPEENELLVENLRSWYNKNR
jgi:Ser/Thr protein kinase RdoA (MazF antagonist)